MRSVVAVEFSFVQMTLSRYIFCNQNCYRKTLLIAKFMWQILRFLRYNKTINRCSYIAKCSQTFWLSPKLHFIPSTQKNWTHVFQDSTWKADGTCRSLDKEHRPSDWEYFWNAWILKSQQFLQSVQGIFWENTTRI